ncbi:CsgBAC operon transcriptional regulatory protein [Thiorhodovibrio winogradskyi]|uniref:CsgBAC operon transcriptional regulatory protein n=1 Tax=Thiorhodovibrio winogradskyi TaxID=77007 RepID=A0ABZ0SFN8_9GAMM|nr:helix-turn-helix transcriptional regulator [Thiorhodovibrio winogradskyi]
MNGSPAPKGAKGAPRQLELTPRQRQILSLICKGKANKEIARDLDISLGTVKQHIAALFKRMNVQNRSMAVAQGKGLFDQPSSGPGAVTPPRIVGGDATDEVLLIRRPCIVLALTVASSFDAASCQAFQARLATLGPAMGAVHLSRGAAGAVLLFGVRKASVWDSIKALLLLRQLRDWVAERGASKDQPLSAALDAGIAVISINPQGSWSGDTVATPVISVTRRLLATLSAGTLGIGKQALHLLAAFHAGEALSSRNLSGDHGLALRDLERLFKLDFERNTSDQSARSHWQGLGAILDARRGQRLQLLGPQGSGKTHLCRALLARARALGREARYLRVLPETPAAPMLADADSGTRVTDEALAALVATVAAAEGGLLIIDDFDLLAPSARSALALQLQPVPAATGLLVLTAREQAIAGGDTLMLAGLDAPELERLLAGKGGAGADDRNLDPSALLAWIQGRPLFALELAAQEWIADAPRGLPLPVLLAMASEFDQHRLDWRLLRALNEGMLEPTAERIHALTAMPIAEIEAGITAAVAAGLLMRAGPNGHPRFTSALMQRAVEAILV